MPATVRNRTVGGGMTMGGTIMRKAKHGYLVAAAVALVAGAGVVPAPAQAQEKWIGQIVPTAANFCPRGSADASGQLIPISQNTALFSLLGTTYGGNGQTNFALPDMRGRLEMHVGQGPGLTPRDQGEMTGQENTTLTTLNLPAHTHSPQMRVSNATSTLRNPINAYIATSQNNAFDTAAPTVHLMAADAIQSNTVGNSIPFNNIQPSLVVRHCIWLQGVYPPRP